MIRRTKDIIIKLLVIVTGLILLTLFCNNTIYSLNNNTVQYDHKSDPSTMEDYSLINDEDGNRYAGRIWTDKSVFSNNTDVTLTIDKDGCENNIKYDTDFLNVFSALGSSQKIDRFISKPVDVVLLLDISSSMTSKTEGVVDSNDSLHKVINQTNTLINQLMGNDPSLNVNKDNKIGIVVYGGGSQELLPLDHYTSLSDNSYIK